MEKGDRVLVERRVDDDPDWENEWTDQMDQAIGKEFVVREVHDKHGVRLDSATQWHWFPLSSLKNLSDEQAAAAEEPKEDVDDVIPVIEAEAPAPLGTPDPEKAAELEAKLGARGGISISGKNRNQVKTWVRKKTGLPFKAVWQTPHARLRELYNDVSDGALAKFVEDYQCQAEHEGPRLEIRDQDTLNAIKKELSSIRRNMCREVGRVDRILKALTGPKFVAKDKQPERTKITGTDNSMEGSITLRRPSIG